MFLLRRLVPPVADGVIAGIDAILISHAHADHLDPPSLRRIPSARVLAPPAVAGALRGRDATAMTAGATAAVGPVEIEAVHARHDGRRWPHGPAAEAIGFVVRGDVAAYFAGDTDLYPEMAELRGRVDVAFLPVWGWGPTLPAGHMDPERAARAAAMIAPRVAIPIHWGALGLPWTRASAAPAEAFAAAVARLAPDVEVRVLEPGESTTVSVGPVVPAPRT